MKFRMIIDEDQREITVLTENGGVACIREAEGDDRLAVTDYYQSRLTDFDGLTADNAFDLLGQGKMYCNDWDVPYNDLGLILDALKWLAVGETSWQHTESLFNELF
jgi:hypothetical protein